MALFNEILVGRLNRWAQKFYAIKSGTASLTQLVPTVQTVNVVQSGVEDRYLQGWNRFMTQATSPAVAASNSDLEIRNPPGSSVVVVVEQIFTMPAATSLCQLRLVPTTGDGATILNPGFTRIDRRGNPGPSSILSIGTATLAAQTESSFRMLQATTNSTTGFINTTNQEITVLPGDALFTLCELVNTAMSVGIMWRERPLESSELT